MIISEVGHSRGIFCHISVCLHTFERESEREVSYIARDRKIFFQHFETYSRGAYMRYRPHANRRSWPNEVTLISLLSQLNKRWWKRLRGRCQRNSPARAPKHTIKLEIGRAFQPGSQQKWPRVGLRIAKYVDIIHCSLASL